jgi:hypothetical protein
MYCGLDFQATLRTKLCSLPQFEQRQMIFFSVNVDEDGSNDAYFLYYL